MKPAREDLYSYRVQWSEEDGEHVATCAEFPLTSWLEPEPGEALKGMRALVREMLEDMDASGETPPVPLSMKSFSGKFQVRVPPELHRRLAVQAAEEKVSLNRLVSAKLAG